MRVAENEDETPSDAILHVPIHPQRMTSDIVYNVIPFSERQRGATTDFRQDQNVMIQ